MLQVALGILAAHQSARLNFKRNKQFFKAGIPITGLAKTLESVSKHS